jgi:hypothetical protein
VRNPDQALAEAQRQLQERTQQASGSAEARAQLTRALVEKAREREDVVRLYRRKSLSLADTEAALAEIAREEAALHQELGTIEARSTLVDAYQSELTEARSLLARLQGNLEAVEAENNLEVKRRVIEALVQEIRLAVQPDGNIIAHVCYRFGRPRVASNGSANRPITPRSPSTGSYSSPGAP